MSTHMTGTSYEPLVAPPDTVRPDATQIATFVSVVFPYCDGLIPIRSYAEKGHDNGGRPETIWVAADEDAATSLYATAVTAAADGRAVYVIPGTVEATGQARASDVRQMQSIVVDLDNGDIEAKLGHLQQHLGRPTLVVESGGRTEQGSPKLHVWWRLSEAAEGADLDLVCEVRGIIADKVDGDPHFRSAHQPIRVAGTVHQKFGLQRLATICTHNPDVEVHLETFAEAVRTMPPLPGGKHTMAYTPARPVVDRVLLTPVRENGLDEWTRFEGASVAIGHYVRMAHTGRLTPAEGWEGVCEYNAAQLRPPWPLDRLRSEYDRLTLRHEQQYGPAKTPRIDPVPVPVAIHRLGDLLDDDSPIPDDLISPRVLTPEGMLVLAGAPKVGKSDLLIHLLVHAAAGEPFLVFTFPRPLRIFYLHAEIDYHYLRERLQTSGIDPGVLQRARQNLVMTSKLRMLLDESGVDRIAAIISEQFGDQPPDIICIDPIRNLFDGGIYEGGENANAAMLFFLQQRVEILRAEVAPGAGLTLIHHTRKSTKEQLQDDPFQAISGASSLRSYYTSGVLMHRPDESQPQRQLEIELRNGPGLEPIQIVKHGGQWVVVDQRKQRITQRESGRKWDAERDRRRDVIVDLIESEGREGRLYTTNQFAERFEGQSDLGGKDTVRNRIGVLATKGWIKFTRAVAGATLPPTTSRWGYLCVEHMQIPGDDEKVDPTTGEVTKGMVTVLPAQYKCPQTGTAQPVENPMVWVYHDDLAPLE